MQWYVSQNGRTLGPFTEQRVAMLVNWGKIGDDAYICDDKWSCWVAVSRSQFAPLISAHDAEQQPERESQAARGSSEPPGAQGQWFGHRMALALLLMLAAAAFLLALWLAPNVNAGPLGRAQTESASVRIS